MRKKISLPDFEATVIMLKLRTSFAQAQLLILLVSTDLVFIGLYLFYSFGSGIDNPLFSLSRDRGYAELFQYIKELWLFLMLSMMAYRLRSSLPLAWALLFGLLLADDSLQLHERGGKLLAPFLHLSPDVVTNLAEAVFAGCMLFIPIGLIVLTYRRSRRSVKYFARQLFIGLAILILFGVGGDVLHGLLRGPVSSVIGVVVEDGGEMLVMSYLTWITFVANPTEATIAKPQPTNIEL